MADNVNRSDCDNTTSSSGDGWQFTSARFIAAVAALIAFNLVVIIGNSLVIAAVFTHRNLRTVTNTFIVSLAVADLLLGAVVLPFSSVNEILGWWPFGSIWCSAWLAIDVWVCTASILNLCAISLDRYLAISRPFEYPLLMSPTRAKVAVAVVWTLALAICLPPLFGWRDSDVGNVAVATKHPCDVINVNYDIYHTVKTINSVADNGKTGNKSKMQSLAMNGSHWTADKHRSDVYSPKSSVDKNAFNIAKRSTTNSDMKRSYATHLTYLTYQRITNAVNSKQRSEFVGNDATTMSTVDVATHAVWRKSSRIIRHSRTGILHDAMKKRETVNWDIDSNLPSDAVTTMASFNACRVASNAPRPVCMLTSEPGYIIYSACGSFWIPMLVMVFFYLKIYRTAVKATTALNSGVLTTKTGRIASSSSEVAVVNLRIHRGGGSSVGGSTVPTSSEYWKSTPNQRSNTCTSVNRMTPRYGNGVDDDRDNDSDRKLRIHGTSTSDGNRFRRPSGDKRISHEQAVISGCEADTVDESGRHPATNRVTGCWVWNKTALRVSSSRRDNHAGLTDVTDAADSSQRRTSSSRRRRGVSAGLSNDSDVATGPIPEEGLDSLVQSTLTPMFQQCSASARRSRADGGNVELVDESAGYTAGRRFVQIRTQLRRLNREKKAAKTVGVIVGCFVLCWAPFFTVYVLDVFCAKCTQPFVFVVFFWLGYCNSAINPFVYALCSKDFRFAFRRLLRCGHESRRNGNSSAVATLVNRLRSSPAPGTGSQSANAVVASRRLCCQSPMTNIRMTTRC